MLEHLHGPQDKNDQLELDKHIKRQRYFLALLAVLLLGALAFSVFSCSPSKSASKISPTKTLVEPKVEKPTKPEPTPQADPQGELVKRFAHLAKDKYPAAKPTNTTTEAVAVLSYPWRDWRTQGTINGYYGNRPALLKMLPDRGIDKPSYLSLEWKWQMPAEKAWLPNLDREMGYSIADANPGIEAANSRKSEAALPRIGAEITWEGVEAVAKALSVEHLVIINWAVRSEVTEKGMTQIGGDGWQFWTYSQGDKRAETDTPAIHRWPKSLAFTSLRAGLAKEVSKATGKTIAKDPMPKDSDWAAVLSEMKMDLLEGRIASAKQKFSKLQATKPKDDSAIYALYEFTRDTKFPILSAAAQAQRSDLHALAIEKIYDYVEAGGKSLRLRTLMAGNLVYDPGKYPEKVSRIARSLLLGVINEDPLFHEAYNQIRNCPNYDESGKLADFSSIRHAEEMIRLHPKEGRYYLALARDKAIYQGTAATALNLLNQAEMLSPWRRGIHFYRAMANLTMADQMRKDKADKAITEATYLKAYRAALKGWQANRSEVAFWLDIMSQSMAYGRSNKNARRGPEYPEVPNDASHLLPLFAATVIQTTYYSTPLDVAHASTIQRNIFGIQSKRREWAENRLRSETDKILNGKYTGVKSDGLRGAADLELILLAGMSQAIADNGANPGNKELQKRAQAALHFYRGLGARFSVLEERLALSRR